MQLLIRACNPTNTGQSLRLRRGLRIQRFTDLGHSLGVQLGLQLRLNLSIQTVPANMQSLDHFSEPL